MRKKTQNERNGNDYTMHHEGPPQDKVLRVAIDHKWINVRKRKEHLVYQTMSAWFEHVFPGNCQVFPASIWGVILPVTLNAQSNLATSLFFVHNTQFIGATKHHLVCWSLI